MRRAALRAFRQGTRVNFEEYAQELIDELTKTMTRSHLEGVRLEPQELRLQSEELLRRVATRFDIPYEGLVQTYFPQAMRAITSYLGTAGDVINNTITELIIGGAHVREAQKALGETFQTQGLTENAYRLETLFRTGTQTAYNTAKYVVDQQPYVQEMLWGYRYVTAGDDRVRETHAEMDGVTAPVDDPIWKVWWPPNGYNCRCQLISLFEPEEIVLPSQPVLPDDGFRSNPGMRLSHACSLCTAG